MRSRAQIILFAGLCGLCLVLDVRLVARYRAFGDFLAHPSTANSRYNVGRVGGLPGLLILTAGCIWLCAVIWRSTSSKLARLASSVAVAAVAAALLVAPFGSRAFLADRRTDALTGVVLLAVGLLMLGWSGYAWLRVPPHQGLGPIARGGGQ